MTDEEKILSEFRILASEFDAVKFPDEFILTRVELYKDFCGKKYFGKFWSRAVALLTAHFLTLEKLKGSEGATSFAITGGTLTSEKEGDLQRSYSSSSNSSNTADELFTKTLYGKMFLQLRSMCIVPATIRKGFDICGRKCSRY